MSKNRYEYEINGVSYFLKTDRDKSEADKIVDYVDMKINEAKANISYNNHSMFVTLACLNIADDLLAVEEKYNDLKEKSKEPLENYGPLKEKFDLYVKEHQSTDEIISKLELRVRESENILSHTKKERDNFKLQLDREIKLLEKNKNDNEYLRKKLLEQEKLTLQAKKQVQELLK